MAIYLLPLLMTEFIDSAASPLATRLFSHNKVTERQISTPFTNGIEEVRTLQPNELHESLIKTL